MLWSFTNDFSPFVAPQLWAAKAGTKIGIVGQGFSGATGVTFGGIAAGNYTVMSDTYLVATVPTGARIGLITVYETSQTLSTLKKFKVLN